MPQPFTDLTAEPAAWPPLRDTYYGLRLAEGEDDDGELFVDGHPPRRRLLAACNQYAREQWGRTNLLDGEVGPGDVDRYVHIRRLWADLDRERWVAAGTPGAVPYTVVHAG